MTDDNTKRVSFGSSENVQLIVYDDPDRGVCSLRSKRIEVPRQSTLDRIVVKSDSCEVPRPISPPAQLGQNVTEQYHLAKMESEVDNPFRPKDALYNEVDPIVEAYKQRPFPPSPTGSPVPPDLTPIKNGKHVTLECGVTHSDSNHVGVCETHPLKTTAALNAENGYSDEIPPPESAELVHMDKGKKCTCCSIQ